MEVRPGYKRTELGVFPGHWQIDGLGRFWSVTDCKHVTAKFTANGYPVASIMEVQSRYLDLTGAGHTSQRFYNLLTEGGRKPRVGNLILSRNATVGEVAQVAEWHLPFAMGQDVCLLRKKSATFSTDYLQAVFRSPIVANQFSDLMVGSTFKRVNVEQIRNLTVPMPPPGEQAAIARALSDADTLIELLGQLLVKKRQVKQGVMQTLLTGKKRLPGFEGEWECMFVEDVIARFFCGPSPTCEERNIVGDSEWGVLKTTAITWKAGWDSTKHKALPSSFWNRPQLEVKTGDVIVTKAGPRHRVGVTTWVDYAPPRIIVSGKMIGLRPDPTKALPLILASAIAAREPQAFLDQRTTGMAESQVNFENEALLRTPIRMPRMDEQSAIAAILSDIDMEIAELEAKLAKELQVKQGMMQELLTGRIRLV